MSIILYWWTSTCWLCGWVWGLCGRGLLYFGSCVGR